MDDCTITSKSAGIVTAVNVSVGDVNTANATLVTVENNTDMIVNASDNRKKYSETAGRYESNHYF